MNLKEKAMLVKFSRTAWSAKKFDRKVTAEVDAQYSAHDAGRYNKVLIAKEALEKAQKAANEARTFVYAQTLPWSDEGWRILTSANYQGFTQEMRKKISAIQTADRDFIEDYPEFKEEAKTRLNGLYNEQDYPAIGEIAKKFSSSVQFSPIPESADFRIPEGMTRAEMEAIGQDLDNRVKMATQEAVKDLWKRLYEPVEHMAEKLSDIDGIFRDSLVKNISEICDLLPRLNLTNDPNLEDMRKQIKERLTKYEPETLRVKESDNPLDKEIKTAARKETAEEAKKILESMEAYFTPMK